MEDNTLYSSFLRDRGIKPLDPTEKNLFSQEQAEIESLGPIKSAVGTGTPWKIDTLEEAGAYMPNYQLGEAQWESKKGTPMSSLISPSIDSDSQIYPLSQIIRMDKEEETQEELGGFNPNRSNFLFNQHIHGAYYSGWDSLSKRDKQTIESFFPEFEDLESTKEKDLYLKALIVDDIYSQNKDPKYQEVLGSLPQDGVTLDTLDTLFNSAFTDESNQMFTPKRALGASLQEARRLNKLLGDYENPNVVENLEKQKSYTDPNNFIPKGKYTDLKKEVYKNADKNVFEAQKEYRAQLNGLSQEEQKATVDGFKSFMSEISPNLFKEYKNSDKVTWKESQYLDLFAKYQADASIYGEEYAATRLKNTIQDHVANNQGVVEKSLHGVANFGINTAVSVAGLVVPIAGLVEMAADGEWETAALIDNTVSRYLNALQTTGSFNPEIQQQRLEDGTNALAILNTVDQDDAILHWNSIYELMGQAGYATGFMLSGGIVNKTAQLTTKGLLALSKGAVKVVNAGQAINRNSKLVNYYLTNKKVLSRAATASSLIANGAQDASMEALQTKISAYSEQKDGIESRYAHRIRTEILQEIQDNPTKFAKEWFHDNTWYLPEGEKNYDALNSVSELDLFKHFSNPEHPYYQQKARFYETLKQQELQEADETSDSAMLAHFAVSAPFKIINNGTLKAALNAPSVRKALSAGGKPLFEGVKVELKNGNIVAAAKELTRPELLKEAGKVFLGESLDEAKDSTDSAFGRGFGNSIMDSYLYNRYNTGNISDAVETDFLEFSSAVLSGGKTAAESALTKETIQAALYGGLSTLVRVSPNVKMGQDNGKTGVKGAISRWSPLSIETSLSTLWGGQDNNPIYQERKALADYINEALQNDTNLQMLFQATESASAMQKFAEALAMNDAKGSKDAKSDMAISSVSFLSMIQGTDAYNFIIESLNQRANFDVANLADATSNESIAVQEFYNEAESNKTMSKEEVVTQMQQSASTILNAMEEAKEAIGDYQDTFGEVRDPDFLNAWIKYSLTYNDRSRRFKNLDEEIKNETSKQKGIKRERSKLTSSMKDFISQYGTLSNAKKDLQRNRGNVAKMIEKLKSQKAPLSAIREYEKQANKELQAQAKSIEKFENETKDLTAEEMIMNVEEFMELSPIQRAALIEMSQFHQDRKDVPHVSNGQAKVIKSLNQGFRSKVHDLGLLRQEIERLEGERTDLLLNPEGAYNYFNEERSKIIRRRMDNKYKHLLDSEMSFDDFFNAYNAAVQNASNPTEAQAILRTARRSPHYAKLEEIDKKWDTIRAKVRYSKFFKSLSDEDKANIDAVLEYMYDNQIPFTYNTPLDTTIGLLENLTDQELLDIMDRKYGKGKYVAQDKNKLAQNLVTTFKEYQQQEQQIQQRTAPVVPTAPPKSSGNVIFDAVAATEDPVRSEALVLLDKLFAIAGDKLSSKAKEKLVNRLWQASVNNMSAEALVDELISATSKKEKQILTEALRSLNREDPQTLIFSTSTENSSPEVKAFAAKHKIGQKVDDATHTSKEVIFYTPSELEDKGINGNKVTVALVANENGTITLDGKKYSAVGINESLRGTLTIERIYENGDIVYREAASIEDVKAKALSKGDTLVPLRDAKNAPSDIADRIESGDFETEGGKHYSQLHVNIPRGKGEDLDIPIFVIGVDTVTNSEGVTLVSLLQKNASPTQISSFNSTISSFAKTLESVLKKNILSDKKLTKLFNDFFKWSYIPNTTYTTIKNDDGTYSLIVKTSEDDRLVLATGITANANGGLVITPETIKQILTSMILDPQGNLRMSLEGPTFMFNINYEDTESIQRGIDDGILGTYHKVLAYNSDYVQVRLRTETKPSEVTTATDTAAPIQSAEAVPETTSTVVEEPVLDPEFLDETAPIIENEGNEEISQDVIDDEMLLNITTSSRTSKQLEILANYYRKEFKTQKYRDKHKQRVAAAKQAAFPYENHHYKQEGNQSYSATYENAVRGLNQAKEVLNQYGVVKSVTLKRHESGYGWKIQVRYKSFDEYCDYCIKVLPYYSTEKIEGFYQTMLRDTKMEDTLLSTTAIAQEVQKIGGVLTKNKALMEDSPINSQLEELLGRVLKSFGFSIIEQDLQSMFGKNVLGAMDFAHKLIMLSENRANAFTGIEEFSHGIVALIKRGLPEKIAKALNADTLSYEDLTSVLVGSSFFDSIYQEYKDKYVLEDKSPNTEKIMEEAIGQAFAAVISERYDAKFSENSTITSKIKLFIQDLIRSIKTWISRRPSNKLTEDILYRELSKVADALLKNADTISEMVDTINMETLIEEQIGEKPKNQEENKKLRQEASKYLLKISSKTHIPISKIDKDTKRLLEKAGITQEKWEVLPKAVQEVLIECRSVL